MVTNASFIVDTSKQDLYEDEYSIPLCIDDLLTICKEYTKLGWNIQSQIDAMLENGVQQSVEQGLVKKEALPHIRGFLSQILKNPYFGDAASSSYDMIALIDEIKTVQSMLN